MLTSRGLALRDAPQLNGAPQEEPGLAERFALDEPVSGEIDVDADFAVTLQ